MHSLGYPITPQTLFTVRMPCPTRQRLSHSPSQQRKPVLMMHTLTVFRLSDVKVSSVCWSAVSRYFWEFSCCLWLINSNLSTMINASVVCRCRITTCPLNASPWTSPLVRGFFFPPSLIFVFKFLTQRNGSRQLDWPHESPDVLQNHSEITNSPQFSPPELELLAFVKKKKALSIRQAIRANITNVF